MHACMSGTAITFFIPERILRGRYCFMPVETVNMRSWTCSFSPFHCPARDLIFLRHRRKELINKHKYIRDLSMRNVLKEKLFSRRKQLTTASIDKYIPTVLWSAHSISRRLLPIRLFLGRSQCAAPVATMGRPYFFRYLHFLSNEQWHWAQWDISWSDCSCWCL